jgi:hypothetical protein
MRRFRVMLVAPFGSLFLVPVGLEAASAQAASAQAAPTHVLRPVNMDVSPDLRTMPMRQSAPPLAPSVKNLNPEPLADEVGSGSNVSTAANAEPAPVVTQNFEAPSAALAPTPGSNFEGLGLGFPGFNLTSAPPRPTLAVGPNHVVQAVNSMFAVFNKSSAVVFGPVNGNTLFAGFGGLCETTNRGYPIVAYDKMADRWIFSQFAFPDILTGPYLQCFAVSTTNDPAGSYYRYAYPFSGYNDDPMLGIWPNAYYTSYNIFAPSSFASLGVALCAHDRVKMLAGDSGATMLCAPTANYADGTSFLPADLEGSTELPAANAPGLFTRLSDAPNELRIVRAAPSFATGTLTLNDGQGGDFGSFVRLPTGTFQRACNCVRQPGTTNVLQTTGNRLNSRLGYRKRGGVETLTANIPVDPDGAGRRAATIRWFEIRDPLGPSPTLHQNSTFDPDGSSDRWMASSATDKDGNIAMGYSVANADTGVKPGIRFTGRLRTDPPNQMQAESTIVVGGGSQTGSLTRWGDHSYMRVDPDDDCTFWYTNEYLGSDGTFNWRTRIANFKFPTCGVPDTTVPTVSISAPTVGQVIPTAPVTINGTAADNVGVHAVRVAVYRNVAGGQYWNGTGWQAANTTVPVTLGSPGATSTSWSYTFNAPPGGVFAVAALAYDAANNFGLANYQTFAIADTTVPTVSISLPFPGQQVGFRPVTITGNASDNAGVGDVQIAIYRPVDPNGQFWNGAAWQTSYTTVTATVTNPGGLNTSFTYDFNPPQSGGYFYVAAVALDTSYRYSLTPFQLFVLPDSTAPTATLSSPAAGNTTGVISIVGTATDDVSVNRVGLAVYREATGQYWNGSGWQAAFTTFGNALLAAPGATSTSFSASYTPAVTGRLYVGVVPSDGNYNYTLSNWTIVNVT